MIRVGGKPLSRGYLYALAWLALELGSENKRVDISVFALVEGGHNSWKVAPCTTDPVKVWWRAHSRGYTRKSDGGRTDIRALIRKKPTSSLLSSTDKTGNPVCSVVPAGGSVGGGDGLSEVFVLIDHRPDRTASSLIFFTECQT